MKVFRFRCLCLGLVAFSAVSMRAKEIKVTFDAKDYKSDKDWTRFVKALWQRLSCNPYCIRSDCKFHLHILNGDIFGTEPPKLSDCFEAGNNRSLAEEVFGKVSALNIKSRKFSTRSLERLFTKATDIFLDGTETIEGTLPETCKLHVRLEIDPFNGKPSSDGGFLLSRFVGVVFELLKRYPDDQRVIFELTVKNGDFFNSEPITDYRSSLDKQESNQQEITKILSRIKVLQVYTKHFSTLSLLKVFPWVEALILPNAECISGISKETSLRISPQDCDKMEDIIRNPSPRLERVRAPKVTKIANAAFFGFQNLQAVNAYPPSYGEKQPAIVCTSLPEDYFAQHAAPKNTRIAPVTYQVLGYTDTDGEKQTEVSKDSNKTVEIGADAFARCFSLQHVSAHISKIGYGAFAASGLKSAHLLLSESATVGKDVFYNCFYLKECLMMSDQWEGEFTENFDGWFWNCFSLKTICMPNVRCHEFFVSQAPHSVRKYPLPTNVEKSVKPTRVFINCFSLEELDLRCYTTHYCNCLPCDVLQFNHQKARGYNFRSSYYASFESGIPREVPVDGYSDIVKGYIQLSCEAIDEPCAIPIHAPKPWGPLCKIKTVIYNPELLKILECSSRPLIYPYQVLACNKYVEAGSFSRSFENPESLYDKNLPSSFQRFNDAYSKWFILPFEKEKKEKPQNEMIGRKTKRTNFLLHGG